jgi:hypothetical protein
MSLGATTDKDPCSNELLILAPDGDSYNLEMTGNKSTTALYILQYLLTRQSDTILIRLEGFVPTRIQQSFEGNSDIPHQGYYQCILF